MPRANHIAAARPGFVVVVVIVDVVVVVIVVTQDVLAVIHCCSVVHVGLKVGALAYILRNEAVHTAMQGLSPDACRCGTRSPLMPAIYHLDTVSY